MILASLSLSLAAAAAPTPFDLVEGMPIGHLHLPTLEGDMVDLAEFRGTKVLLIEFASW